MGARIQTVNENSPAKRAGIRAGQILLEVDGHPIADVLDYKFYTYDSQLTLILAEENGARKTITLQKEEGEDLGLEFGTYLMDQTRSCINHCIFCFVDQMPCGLRDSLYEKDDDARLSFLLGNYITLTNLTPREVQRIIALQISPLHISVHSTNPALRSFLLGNRNGGKSLAILQRFAQAGIVMHCQIVACPGINDGEELARSMTDLMAMHPMIASVSVVPVGLTKYREGSFVLRPYTKEEAIQVIDMVEDFGARCRAQLETTIFFCADEFYLKAGRSLPNHAYYEEYPQLENGVGMLRLLRQEFEEAMAQIRPLHPPAPFSVATGVAAAPFLRGLIDLAKENCHNILGMVYPIANDFFGDTIDVAGLVTGRDLMAQLKGKWLGNRLFIPANMLRHEQTSLIEDVTTQQVSEILQVPVIPVEPDGAALACAIFGE